VKLKILFLALIFLFTTFFTHSQNDSLNPLAKYKNFEPFEDYPGLIGGYDLLQSKIRYPVEAIINNIEGKVVVKVSIDTMGLPVKIELKKGIGFGCDEEVIKAIKATIFIPPMVNGKPIESFLYIPITFKIPQQR
jgi:TonB family protein